MDTKNNALMMNLVGRCLELVDARDELTQSDMQGAFMAIIMEAINKGK